MKKSIVCITLIFLIIIPVGVQAENIVMNSIGKMGGYTLYDITFNDGVYTGRSELVFNIDILIEEIKYVNYSNKRSFDYSLELKSDYLFKNSGLLVDSDWENDSLNIYSETKTDLDLFHLDFKLKSKSLTDNLDFRIIAGYEWQNYYFVGYGTEQINYTTDPTTIVNFSDYRIPYLAFSLGSKNMKEKSYRLTIGYSSLVVANDIDHHLLRNKWSKSNTEGEAYFTEVNMDFKIRENQYYVINAEYINIETSGTQTQYLEDGRIIENIPTNVNSIQTLLSFGYKLCF